MIKFTYELACKIRDEVHDEVQRQLLSSTSGSSTMDAADRGYKAFSKYYLRDSLEDFIHSVRTIVAERGDFYFRKMSKNQTYLEELLNPENYYKTTKKEEDNQIEKVTETDIVKDNKTGTGTYHYDFNETTDDSRTGTLARGANSHTSTKNKGLENKGKKNPLLNVGNTQQLVKKEIDIDKLMEGDGNFKISKAEVKLVQPEELEEELLGGEMYGTVNVGVTGGVSNLHSSRENEGLDVSKFIEEGKTQFDHGAVQEEEKDLTIKEFTRSNALKDVLKVPYPDVYNQFFRQFHHLFKLIG